MRALLVHVRRVRVATPRAPDTRATRVLTTRLVTDIMSTVAIVAQVGKGKVDINYDGKLGDKAGTRAGVRCLSDTNSSGGGSEQAVAAASPSSF